MSSVAEMEKYFHMILEERSEELARELGCVKRARKFSGADVVQTLVFGFQQHPHASLEQLASFANVRGVQVSDTAIHQRFNESCALLLHAVLQELTNVVVQAQRPVPLALLRRFPEVLFEDSSSIALPDELADVWQGCGGSQRHTSAVVKVHTRWELRRGRLWGPQLSNGRTSDRKSPFTHLPVVHGSLLIRDLGYFSLPQIVERWEAGGWSLTRLQAGTALFTPDGGALCLETVLPKEVGEMKEMAVLVGARRLHAMRLLLVRVPKEVGEERRADLREGARRRGQPISERTLMLADWTILVTDVPACLLRLQEALVLLRQRWQMELLYKLWKQYAQIDEWHTGNRWRVLCELYAKLIGVLLQHWMIVLFAWHDPQRSLVKLAQVVRDSSVSLMEALAGSRSLRSALRTIQRRMQSGCQMNQRRTHPNAAQLLQAQTVEWPLSWCE
jgi:hypothetical protein